MLAATSAAVLAAGREPSGRGRAGVADPPYEKVCCVSMLGRYGLSASLEAPAAAEGVRRRVRLGGAILYSSDWEVAVIAVEVVEVVEVVAVVEVIVEVVEVMAG